MPNKLDSFVAECRDALQTHPGTAGREKVKDLVKQVLADPEFVATYIPEGTPERHVLYEDPELGFTVLAHGYTGAKGSKPHDHGPSWAIYGQAAGETIMTAWDCVARPTEASPGQAKFNHDYVMKPGDAYLYDVGVLHSPERKGSTRLLRIEGLNMAKIKRLPYEAVSQQAAAE
jgi:predicted metal-dependent enzyme (double-stranded beta helix superfamily)